MIDSEENENALPFSEDWANILEQEEFWVTASGRRTPLDAMDPTHCANTVAFIKRSLSRLAERDLLAMTLSPGPSGDVACGAFDGAMDELEHIVENAQAWAEGTPLVKALNRRAQGDTYYRASKSVRAIQYDGKNIDAIVAFVGDESIPVGQRIPSPGRYSHQIVVVGSAHTSTKVLAGNWLLLEDGHYRSIPNNVFKSKYRKEVPK